MVADACSRRKACKIEPLVRDTRSRCEVVLHSHGVGNDAWLQYAFNTTYQRSRSWLIWERHLQIFCRIVRADTDPASPSCPAVMAQKRKHNWPLEEKSCVPMMPPTPQSASRGDAVRGWAARRTPRDSGCTHCELSWCVSVTWCAG